MAAALTEFALRHSSKASCRLAGVVPKKQALRKSVAVSLRPCGPAGPPGGNLSGLASPNSAAATSLKAQSLSKGLHTLGSGSPLTGHTARRSSRGQIQRPQPGSSSPSSSSRAPACCWARIFSSWAFCVSSPPASPTRKSAAPKTKSRFPTHSGMDSIQPRASAPRCFCWAWALRLNKASVCWRNLSCEAKRRPVVEHWCGNSLKNLFNMTSMAGSTCK
mmetsp:Transcript_12737/g.45100  ORF Transcript_12737/g.45100 Transcript_12737/m.45100 type:complete len:219 (+) Transcript_12737:321-977(+)